MDFYFFLDSRFRGNDTRLDCRLRRNDTSGSSPGGAFGIASGPAGLSRKGERRTGFLLSQE